MSTSTTLTIPHDLVGTLRDGLHAELADAAGGIVAASQTAEAKRDYTEPLEQFDATRRLLDLTGWSSPRVEVSVPVQLDVHQHALLAALRGEIRTLQDMLEEANVIDVIRVATAKSLKREQMLARIAALQRLLERAESHRERPRLG